MDRTDELLARHEREYMNLHSVSADYRRQQPRTLRALAAHADKPLDQITSADVSAYIGARVQGGLHPNSARTYLAHIKGFFRWAAQVDAVDVGVIHALELLGNPRGWTASNEPKPYKPEDIARFRAALATKYPIMPTKGPGKYMLHNFVNGKHNRLRRQLWRHARRLQFEAQIALALELGLRRIEIYRVTLAQMHPNNESVIVLTAKQGPRSERVRAVPYTTHARGAVQDWLNLRSLLIPPHDQPWLKLVRVGDRTDQLQPQNFATFARALREIEGDWAWHRFRHTFATEWLRAGVPLEKVQVALGHSNIQQTRVYTKVNDTDVLNAYLASEERFARRLGLA